MRLSKFTLSDDDEQLDGYTDGSLWNGWASVFFTREQVVEFLPTVYDVIFVEPHTAMNHRDYPILILNNGRETEVVESTPFEDEDGNMVEGYSFDGWEFMEVDFMEVDAENQDKFILGNDNVE